MVNKDLIAAIATLVGTIIGAGILGIPFVVSKAGFLTALPLIIILGLIFLLVNLSLGEITLRTKGAHQLTGYMEKYLGKPGKFFMMLSMIFGIYGALLAYMIGVGQSLNAILGGGSFVWSILFFIVGSFVVYGSIEWLKKSETLLMFFMLTVFAIITLFLFFSGKFNFDNLTVFHPNLFFLPFGVVLFAYLGTSAIPEINRELKNKKLMKKAILFGTFLPIIVYSLFAFGVVGVTGEKATEVATVGIGALLGKSAILFFNAFAILTMSTSFISLGFALKDMFKFDYSFNYNISWFLAVIPALLFFLIANPAFSRTLSITGSLSGGLAIVLVLLAYLKAQKVGKRKPEYKIWIPKLLIYFLILLFILGALFDVEIFNYLL
ncbi:amino acid permease [Candidatus Woesearchaeota archaeon]|nr:amino acid permease [Candidatus Woesearchaeota archaeon]